MSAHVQNSMGEWITKEIPGARNLEAWCDAWEFAMTGMGMGDYVDHDIADAYQKFFVNLARCNPRHWWIV